MDIRAEGSPVPAEVCRVLSQVSMEHSSTGVFLHAAWRSCGQGQLLMARTRPELATSVAVWTELPATK